MSNQFPPSQRLMSGMHFEAKAGKPLTLWIDSVDVLRERLGEPVTNAFVRCFAALDRLMSIFDAVHLNTKHTKAGTVRHERNFHTLSVFAAGLVFEFREGIRQLRDADVAGRLSAHGRQRWSKLLEFAHPKHEAVMREIRNNLAFHIGDPDVVARGIRRLAGEDDPYDRKPQAVMSSDDEGGRVNTRHDLGLAAILAGMKVTPAGIPPTPNSRQWMTEEDFKSGLTEAIDGHFAISALFDDVFFDALREVGANLEPLPPMQP
jgi:hypothetical protein